MSGSTLPARMAQDATSHFLMALARGRSHDLTLTRPPSKHLCSFSDAASPPLPLSDLTLSPLSIHHSLTHPPSPLRTRSIHLPALSSPHFSPISASPLSPSPFPGLIHPPLHCSFAPSLRTASSFNLVKRRMDEVGGRGRAWKRVGGEEEEGERKEGGGTWEGGRD